MNIIGACGMRILAELVLSRLDGKLVAALRGNPHWDAFWRGFESEIEAGGVCVRLEGLETSKDAAHLRALALLCAAVEPDCVTTLLRAGPEAFSACVRSLLQRPFVLERTEDSDVGYFYSQRQFLCELRLARALAALSGNDAAFSVGLDAGPEHTGGGFPLSKEQGEAIAMILNRRLTVVSGKPGSGKTTVVVRALSALFSVKPGLSVMQMAPTGKASARIAEALSGAIARHDPQDPGAEALRRAFVEGRIQTKTVQKWLFELKNQPRETGRRRFLDADVVVVDEGSMLSIDLAVSLLESIDPARTRVILLGDKNQLAAVGPGRVFADLCETEGGSVLAGHVAIFQMSHRFPAASRVGRMANLLLDPPSEERDATLLEILSELRLQSVPCPETVDVPARFKRGLSDSVRSWLQMRFGPIRDAVSEFRSAVSSGPDALCVRARTLCSRLRDVRVLCAARAGRNGLEAVNAYMEEWMRLSLHPASKTDPSYVGRLLIVRENRPDLGLANGDVGILLDIGSESQKRIVFVPETFGLNPKDRLEDCLDARELPRCDAAYALTIHQSQGSEYGYVLLVMPENADSGLATRELLYTGVTRVKFTTRELAEECDHLKIVTGPAVWQEVTTRSAERSGRLFHRLGRFGKT